ncbi:MAG TPA: DHA2 family efflux MFS transporter permease subunit [Roseiarcus sp.]|nr:DHA2 family efflux MFS transporter permease subunit [Roseiarcus sp.]
MRPAVLTAFIIATALFMENMDGTVLATSLPAIAHDLGQDPIVLKLALTSYLLTLAVFIPASGWVADRLGARTVFCSAIAVFTLGSILCGASSSLPTLIAARVFQGLGGAMMVPVGRLVLLRSTPKAEMVNALAYLTVPALIGPIAGPPLGGFITTYFQWRWIFWINVPIGLVGIALSLKFIENIREREIARFDFNGFFLSGLGLLALIFGLTIIGRDIVPASVDVGLILGGGVLLAAYVRHARRDPDAIIDLKLLKSPTFFSGVVGGFLFRIGIGAIPFLLPLLLQIGFGLTPFESGSLTFAAAAGAMAMKFSASAILRRWGFRRVLIVNGVISALFLASYGLFTAHTPHWLLVAALLSGGFFRSLEFTALNALGYADIDPARMSRATSFASVVQQMSGAVGVSVAAASIESIRFALGDDQLVARDMSLSFGVVALIALSSIAIFARLKPEAGAEVSGRRVDAGAPAE